MPDYSVYGGRFRSEIDFPELTPLSGNETPEWRLHVVESSAPTVELTLVGEEHIYADVFIRLYRAGKGFRLIYHQMGPFDISADGSEFVWYRGADEDLEAARLLVIGVVFATAFHAAGIYCLHGSAVAIDDEAIAFVAPKFHGKSTLARALTRSGARLASDDAVPLAFGPRVLMRPGVHQVRLWLDSAAHLEEEGMIPRTGFGGKQVLTDFTVDRLMREPTPVAAIYVLVPVKPDASRPPARRTLLPPMQAALSMVSHVKGGALFGGSEASVVLDRASELARKVPVYALEVVREMHRLDEVIGELNAWHGDGSAAEATGVGGR